MKTYLTWLICLSFSSNLLANECSLFGKEDGKYLARVLKQSSKHEGEVFKPLFMLPLKAEYEPFKQIWINPKEIKRRVKLRKLSGGYEISVDGKKIDASKVLFSHLGDKEFTYSHVNPKCQNRSLTFTAPTGYHHKDLYQIISSQNIEMIKSCESEIQQQLKERIVNELKEKGLEVVSSQFQLKELEVHSPTIHGFVKDPVMKSHFSIELEVSKGQEKTKLISSYVINFPTAVDSLGFRVPSIQERPWVAAPDSVHALKRGVVNAMSDEVVIDSNSLFKLLKCNPDAVLTSDEKGVSQKNRGVKKEIESIPGNQKKNSKASIQ